MRAEARPGTGPGPGLGRAWGQGRRGGEGGGQWRREATDCGREGGLLSRQLPAVCNPSPLTHRCLPAVLRGQAGPPRAPPTAPDPTHPPPSAHRDVQLQRGPVGDPVEGQRALLARRAALQQLLARVAAPELLERGVQAAAGARLAAQLALEPQHRPQLRYLQRCGRGRGERGRGEGAGAEEGIASSSGPMVPHGGWGWGKGRAAVRQRALWEGRGRAGVWAGGGYRGADARLFTRGCTWAGAP